MRPRLRRALGLACLVAAAGCAEAPRPDAAPLALDDAPLRTLLDPARPDHLVGLQVAVVVDGRLWERAYGRRFVHPADPTRDLPLAADSLVRAASASKPVVAIAVLQLVEQGRLDLDADLSDLLGFPLRNPRHPGVAITPRMVLAHTSSIVDAAGYALPLGDALAALFTPGPRWDDGAPFSDRAPGTYFEYSNLGSGVLATVVERVTGERFDRVAARAVLARAGVEATFDVASLADAQRARLAVLYRKGPEDALRWDPRGPWLAQMDDPRPAAEGGSGRWSAPGADPRAADYRPGANGALFSPQGGLRISAGDLARLWSCLLRGVAPTPSPRPCRGLLRPATRELMLRPQWAFDPRALNGATEDGLMLAWGLGVQRFTGAHAPGEGRLDSPTARLDGVPLVGHLAFAYGMFGGVLFTPDGRRGVVYFATGSAQPLDANPGRRSAFWGWEEEIVDWAARRW